MEEVMRDDIIEKKDICACIDGLVIDFSCTDPPKAAVLQRNTVAAVGDEFQLNCTAEGDGPITYAWTGPGNTRRQGAFWLVKADSPAQGGLYTCRATNTRITNPTYASSTSIATVIVEMSKTT